MKRWLLLCLVAVTAAVRAAGGIADKPFSQDVAVKFRLHPDLAGAEMRKLCIDKDGVVYVLTDRGVARLFGDVLAADRSFRPLAGKVAKDIALSRAGDLYLLFDDGWLSNAEAGAPGARFARPGAFDQIAVDSSTNLVLTAPMVDPLGKTHTAFATEAGWFVLMSDHIEQRTDAGLRTVATGRGFRTLAVRNGELFIGTTNGWSKLRLSDGRPASPLEQLVPWPDITKIVPVEGGIWFGTPRGAFFQSDGTPSVWATPSAGPKAPAPKFRYYASRRWLADDHVVDLAVDADRSVWILTRTGLQKIGYRSWTLAQKAAWIGQKIRSRHMRYGLTAERRLFQPGDIATSEMIDTDNDGGWSSYWLASQALRFAVTHEPQAKAWAWETFAALERLQTIHTNTGFPARTIERKGFKFSDTDRWRDAPDPGWEWKGHTSSDEITSHLFAYAVLWECAAETPAERRRVAVLVDRIATHILDHDLYLVDVDGKPTLWGRWHPDYVNSFPPTVHDRRLNSAEFTALMQFANKVTGKARYKEKAFEMFRTAGYLTNLTSSMRLLKATPGARHQGIEMGDEWNHSDDELAFNTYWVLARHAFDDGLRAKYRAAVADHWELEKGERFATWNFVTAACGLKDFDPEGAVWTLRGYPLDTVSWSVANSHRKDILRLPPNFRGQEMAELLPPGERLMARCNTQPFILDAGDGGHTEFPGDESVLGYWLGRFVGAINAP